MSTTRLPPMRLCRTTVPPGLCSILPTWTESCDTSIFFRTLSAASACTAGTNAAKRSSFATYSGSRPRISQALCTVSCTGISDSSSLMQKLRSKAIKDRDRMWADGEFRLVESHCLRRKNQGEAPVESTQAMRDVHWCTSSQLIHDDIPFPVCKGRPQHFLSDASC